MVDEGSVIIICTTVMFVSLVWLMSKNKFKHKKGIK
jgi:hypothetical protein